LLNFIAENIQVAEGRILVSPGLEEEKKFELILNKQNRVLVGKAEIRGIPRCRLEGNIKIDLH
jgi:hypothetical protein